MNEKNTKQAKRYFAAANTYQGFKSYFDVVFDPSEYEYIYVLKGGPGTGKSSLMKRISTTFLDKNFDVEEIYCSSDPYSLDGVIISKEDKKIAILDGTAPHERDAKFPCAKDEIINLADGLNKAWIKANAEDISDLSCEKAKAYKSAYNYLALAGRASEIVDKSYNDHFDIFGAKIKAENILYKFSESTSQRETLRLFSSFSRYGRLRLEDIFERYSNVIKVDGDDESVGIFLTLLCSLLRSKKCSFINLPCALDPSMTEALILPDSDLVIMQGDNGEIDANEFFAITPLEHERIKTALRIKDDALNESVRWFAIASDLHFRLEEIYSQAMDFKNNDRICEELITKIANILEINI